MITDQLVERARSHAKTQGCTHFALHVGSHNPDNSTRVLHESVIPSSSYFEGDENALGCGPEREPGSK